MELVDNLIKFDNGDMTDEEIISFMQELIDTEVIGSLEGRYGRAAMSLIRAGRCWKKGDPARPKNENL
jgi:hypothetical protein